MSLFFYKRDSHFGDSNFRVAVIRSPDSFDARDKNVRPRRKIEEIRDFEISLEPGEGGGGKRNKREKFSEFSLTFWAWSPW